MRGSSLSRSFVPARRVTSTTRTLIPTAVGVAVLACGLGGCASGAEAGATGSTRVGLTAPATVDPTATPSASIARSTARSAAASEQAASQRVSATGRTDLSSGSDRCSAAQAAALRRRLGTLRIERCRNGYARVFAPPVDGEQYFLQRSGGSWQVVSQGTGLACSDPDLSGPLLRACTALQYPTSAQPWRISDPQVLADRLVAAWIDHDAGAAGRLVGDESVVDALFSERAPSSQPEQRSCRLFEPGRFACSYVLAARAELTIIVEGGASAGYLATGVEFGD